MLAFVLDRAIEGCDVIWRLIFVKISWASSLFSMGFQYFRNYIFPLPLSSFCFIFSSLSWRLYIYIVINSSYACLISYCLSATSIITICFYLFIRVFSIWSLWLAICLTSTFVVFLTWMVALIFCHNLSYFAVITLVNLRTLEFPTSFTYIPFLI